MKTTIFYFRSALARLGLYIALTSLVSASFAAVTAQLDRSDIAVGESTQLTITTSGDGDAVSPPEVPGLEIVPVGQSSQYQSINGAATSTTSITYDVTAQRAGTFTFPGLKAGKATLVLHVQSGHRSSRSSPNSSLGSSNLPPPAATESADADAHLTPDGAAFVRLRLPKRQLYVGETVPVEIQVGVRPGLAASLNGLPALNADSFTLNKLTTKPEQTQEIVDGKAYTVLTWHSALAAVKPGDFPLTVETPLTIQIRTAPRRRTLGSGMNGSLFDDFFNDPFTQSFFGGTSEKQITVTSDPEALTVQALPADGRPLGFTGAVGNFEVNIEPSALTGVVGDPLTLRLKVKGSGNFDRVNSAMLNGQKAWKTYQPTAKFDPADSADFGGEKTFEQAIIPLQSGRQEVPALSFSYFNPETRSYETKRTAPLNLEITAAPAGAFASPTVSPRSASLPLAQEQDIPRDGLRPDHGETGDTVATLLPVYFQPWFLAGQGALILCFAGGLLYLRQHERSATDANQIRQREASRVIESSLEEMDAASSAADSTRFFQSARSALQQNLATYWHVAPTSITLAEIDSRLNGEGADLRRIFSLADQVAYSKEQPSTADFKEWKKIVRQQLEKKEAM